MAAASFNQFDSGMAGEVEMELQTMDHSADLERRGFNPRRLLRRTSSINYLRRQQIGTPGRVIDKGNGNSTVRQENRTRLMKKQQFAQDGFHTLLESTWAYVLFIFAMSYVCTWLAFAVAWHIANMIDDTCVGKMKTFNGALEFSVETQQSIGYGDKYVEENCLAGTVIMLVQELLGQLLDCFWIGLIFLKMSRPKKRAATLRYSRRACIAVKDEILSLAIRTGDTSIGAVSPWVESHFSLYLYEEKTTSTGFHLAYVQTRLEIADDAPIFVLPYEVTHKITEDSPLYGRSADDFINSKAEIVLVYESVIQSTGNSLHARTSYTADEIIFGRMFVEMSYRDNTGNPVIDWNLFDSTIPCATFNDTTQFDANRLGLTPDNRAADPQSKLAAMRSTSTSVQGSPLAERSMVPSLGELVTLDTDQPSMGVPSIHARKYTSPLPDQPGSPVRTTPKMAPVKRSTGAEAFRKATQRQRGGTQPGGRPPSNLSARSVTEDDYEDADDAMLLLGTT